MVLERLPRQVIRYSTSAKQDKYNYRRLKCDGGAMLQVYACLPPPITYLGSLFLTSWF